MLEHTTIQNEKIVSQIFSHLHVSQEMMLSEVALLLASQKASERRMHVEYFKKNTVRIFRNLIEYFKLRTVPVKWKMIGWAGNLQVKVMSTGKVFWSRCNDLSLYHPKIF